MVQMADLEIADETGHLLASVARKRGESVDDVVRSMLGAREAVPCKADRSDDSFHAVWTQICELAGTEFRTRNGQRFSYRIEGDYVEPSTSDVRIPVSQFKKGLAMGPVRGPSSLRGVFAPSLVWAILNDNRIMEAVEASTAGSAVSNGAHPRGRPAEARGESLPPVDAQISRVHQTWPDDSAYDEGDMPFKTIEPLRKPAEPAGVPLYPENAHVWAIGPASIASSPDPEEEATPEEPAVEETRAAMAFPVSRVNAAAMAALTQAGVAELQRAQSRGSGHLARPESGTDQPFPVTALADLMVAEVFPGNGQAERGTEWQAPVEAAASGGDRAPDLTSEDATTPPHADDADRPEHALRASPLEAQAAPKLRGLIRKLFSSA